MRTEEPKCRSAAGANGVGACLPTYADVSTDAERLILLRVAAAGWECKAKPACDSTLGSRVVINPLAKAGNEFSPDCPVVSKTHLCLSAFVC